MEVEIQSTLMLRHPPHSQEEVLSSLKWSLTLLKWEPPPLNSTPKSAPALQGQCRPSTTIHPQLLRLTSTLRNSRSSPRRPSSSIRTFIPWLRLRPQLQAPPSSRSPNKTSAWSNKCRRSSANSNNQGSMVSPHHHLPCLTSIINSLNKGNEDVSNLNYEET